MSDESVRRVLVMGGSSAGKSYSIAQAVVTEGARGCYSALMFKKVQSNIRDTIRNDVRDIVERIGYDRLYDRMEFEYRGRHGTIRFRGLDDDNKLKGLKGYKKLYFDELDQFTLEDWKEANRRLRGERGQQILASWNPVNEGHWIKQEFIDKTEWVDLPKVVEIKNINSEELTDYTRLSPSSWVRRSADGRTVLIKVTYLDNKWVVGGDVHGRSYGYVDEQALADFEEMRRLFPDDYRVYGLGEWGLTKNAKPYFTSFSKVRNVREGLSAVEGTKLSVGMDFNYGRMAMLVGQKLEDRIIIFDCFRGDTIRDVCREFDIKYGNWRWGYSIYGDASGKNRNAMTGAYNYFTEVKNCLNAPKSVFEKRHRRQVNMAHSQSRALTEYIYALVPVYIDASLTELISETLRAEVIEDPETGRIRLRKDDNLFTMDLVDAKRYLFENLLVDIDEVKRFAKQRRTIDD